MVCPMGIDTASLVHHQRSALVAAELVPPELAALRMEQKHAGTVFGASADSLRKMVDTIREKAGVVIPLDKERAEIMVLSSAVDLVGNGNGLLATARVMNHLGVDWTVCSDGFESANFGLLSGDMSLWKKQVDPIVAAAQRIGAKMLVIAECGHAYPALRWNPMLQKRRIALRDDVHVRVSRASGQGRPAEAESARRARSPITTPARPAVAAAPSMNRAPC